MAKKKLTIDDLLAALKDPNAIDDNLKANPGSLANSKEIWERIGRKDATLATEIGIDQSELNDFLKEWIEDNPYTAIA